MKNVFSKIVARGPVSITLAVVLSVLFVTGLVSAATTISTNISTAGTLTVAGAINASSTLATSGNITVPNGYGLDTAGAGALNLGTTTATSVIIGSSSAKVGVASTSPYVALGVTGTTTASAGMVVGALGSPVTQLLFGTCTYNPAAAITASSSRSTNCTGATGVNTNDRVFVTPRNLGNSLVLTSASSTSSGVIQVTVYYIATSTESGNYTPASATWDWIAIH